MELCWDVTLVRKWELLFRWSGLILDPSLGNRLMISRLLSKARLLPLWPLTSRWLESLRARTQFELMFGPTLVTISVRKNKKRDPSFKLWLSHIPFPSLSYLIGESLIWLQMQGTTMSYVSSRMGSLDTCSSRITGDESRNRFLFGVSFTLERFDRVMYDLRFYVWKTLVFHVTCYVNLTYESYAFWFSVSVLFGFLLVPSHLVLGFVT